MAATHSDKTHTPQTLLNGGAAVITGAGSGIGAALAHAVARLGMRVVVADISGERAEQVAQAINAAGGNAFAAVADVANPAAMDQLAAFAHERCGDIRLLINNAGIETVGYCWEIPAQRWEQILGVNIHGAVHGVRAFVPHMLAADKPAYVVNIASIAAVCMAPLQSAYIMSKHAVLSFSECLLLDLQVRGAPIQVSVVAPGSVSTRIFADAQASAANPLAAEHRTVMNTILAEHGITPEVAAQMILEQMAAGQFWITTHPDQLHDFATERADYLSALATPKISEAGRALLGLDS